MEYSWYVIDFGSIDLLLGGSPCQGFSIAGKQLNFKDPRSKLFFEYSEILKKIRDKNPNILFLLENVKMKKEFQDIISDNLGVNPIEINSNLVSAQNRKRLYWTNIPNIKQPENRGIMLKDIVHEKADIDFAERLEEYIIPLDKMTEGYIRKLTPIEWERLQTLPDNYTQGEISGKEIPDSQRYKMLGNGWTVDIIAHILTGVKKEALP